MLILRVRARNISIGFNNVRAMPYAKARAAPNDKRRPAGRLFYPARLQALAGLARFHISARNGASMLMLTASLIARSPAIQVSQGVPVAAKATLKNTAVSSTAPNTPEINGARHQRWSRRRSKTWMSTSCAQI